jgi:hypothetical protein
MPFSGTSNLARIGRAITISIHGATVGSYRNLIVGSRNGQRGAVAKRRLGKSADRRYEKDSQPKWVRHRYSQSAAWCWPDSKNNLVCIDDTSALARLQAVAVYRQRKNQTLPSEAFFSGAESLP